MSMKVRTKVTNNLGVWIRMTEQNLDNAAHSMADSINILASAKAPVLTGNLKRNGHIEGQRGKYEVVYGDGLVPYARRRHFENRRHPQTLNYLKDGGNQVTKRGIRAFL